MNHKLHLHRKKKKLHSNRLLINLFEMNSSLKGPSDLCIDMEMFYDMDWRRGLLFEKWVDGLLHHFKKIPEWISFLSTFV